MQPADEGQDPASMLFVVLTDERPYPWKGPFLREVGFLFVFFSPFGGTPDCWLTLICVFHSRTAVVGSAQRSLKIGCPCRSTERKHMELSGRDRTCLMIFSRESSFHGAQGCLSALNVDSMLCIAYEESRIASTRNYLSVMFRTWNQNSRLLNRVPLVQSSLLRPRSYFLKVLAQVRCPRPIRIRYLCPRVLALQCRVAAAHK
jgi:hypothetical protein